MNYCDQLCSSLTPAQFQWEEIKRRREKSTGVKFPGFICAEDLSLLLVDLGVRLSATESRELLLMIAPGRNAWQNGKIDQKDLIAFANCTTRMFGQLDACLEKEILKPLVDAYREHREYMRTSGSECPELSEKYITILNNLVALITDANDAPLNDTFNLSSSGLLPSQTALVQNQTSVRTKDIAKPSNLQDVFSLTQLKNGVETAMADIILPNTTTPSLLEWAALACRLGVVVVNYDVYGVRVPKIFEYLCSYLVGSLEDFHVSEKISLEPLCRDLKIMIADEAKRAAGNGKEPNYDAVFKLFDSDSNGKISVEEFTNIMKRWKLLGALPENQVSSLIELFDKSNKGYIDRKDFLLFMEVDKYSEDILESQRDNGEDGDEDTHGFGSNTPPTAITRNPDCDWLLWLLWKEALKIDPSDPEGVVTELEMKCASSLLQGQQQKDTIKMIDLWKIFLELKMKGNLTKAQLAKCILYLVEESRPIEGKQVADDDDQVDFESLCRYTVRMGRSHENIIQERQLSDDKLYKQVLPQLKKELTVMIPINGPSRYFLYKFTVTFIHTDLFLL